MRKTIIFTLFILITANLLAQSVSLSKPYSNTWIRRGFVHSISIGQDESNAYLYQYIRTSDPMQPKSYTDHLYIIDKSSLQSTDIEVTVPKTHILLDGFVNDNNIIAVFRHANKKGDQVNFTVATIDKNDKTVTFNDANTISATTNKSYWPDFKTAKSPDGKMLAILTMVTGKNSQLESIFAAVVNNQGEFVWSGPVAPQFNGKTFSLGNLLVDNNGTIYLPAYTCRLQGESVSNVEFMMNVCKEEGTDSYLEACEFGALQNFTAKILSDGNIVVAGYYTEKHTNTAANSNGYYFYQFDTQTESISDVKNFSFSNNYVEKNAWARFANVLGNQQYSISADNIYELENGSLVLCGEHRFVKAIYDPNMNSYSYQFLTKNILVSTLLTDGTSLFSMIEKQQSAGAPFNIIGDWTPMNISYSAFANQNDMYFVFNDDVKNIPYPGKDVICAVNTLTFPKDMETVVMRLTPQQEITQRVLRDATQHFYSVVFTDDNDFYTTGVGKSNLYFNKYTVEE
jgi:hypothetical protein